MICITLPADLRGLNHVKTLKGVESCHVCKTSGTWVIMVSNVNLNLGLPVTTAETQFQAPTPSYFCLGTKVP